MVGSSWEGYVVEQVKQILGRDLEMFYYRTHQGTECDLVLVKGIKPLASIEIKYSSSPDMTKSFTLAINDLGTKVNFIITPDCDDYTIRENVKVCSLQTFLTSHLKEITSKL